MRASATTRQMLKQKLPHLEPSRFHTRFHSPVFRSSRSSSQSRFLVSFFGGELLRQSRRFHAWRKSAMIINPSQKREIATIAYRKDLFTYFI
jgi:hypothetical protein